MSNSSSSIGGLLHPAMWPGEPRTSLPHRRTKQACDNCKARKAKCSNTKPCTNCQEADILCTSVKAMTRRSTRDWEIEMLRSERTRLVNAVKILHQQLSSRAPHLYAPSTATTNASPPTEPLSVNEIVELIELGQERTKRRGGDDDDDPDPDPDPIHVTPATPSSPSSSSPSPPSSCVSSSYRSEPVAASDGSTAGRRRRLSSGAGGPPTPSNEARQQSAPDAMAEFGLELDCVDDFRWQPPDGADLPSCWAGAMGEGWPELGVGGAGLGLDGVDQLSMDWTAGGDGAVWQ